MQRCEVWVVIPSWAWVFVASKEFWNLNDLFLHWLLLLLHSLLLFHLVFHVQSSTGVLVPYSCVWIILIRVPSSKTLSRICFWLWSPRIISWRWLLVLLSLIAPSINRFILFTRLITSSSRLLLSCSLCLSYPLLLLTFFSYSPCSFHLLFFLLSPVWSLLRSFSTLGIHF